MNRVEVTINLLSLAGIQGPLPTPYTELIIDRLKQKDMGLNDFLDIFNHRLAQLYYKIYKKYTPGFDLCPPDKSMFGKTVLSISGINFSYTLDQKMSNRIFLKYAGILWQRPRSLIGLEQILSDFFKIKVRIHSFQGRFEKIDEQDWTIIGHQGKNSSLGITTIIGQKAWITSSHLRLEFGPFDETTAKYFLGSSVVCEFFWYRAERNNSLLVGVEAQPITVLSAYRLAVFAHACLVARKAVACLL